MPNLAVHAHVKFEVLVHQQSHELPFAASQVRIVLCAIVQDDVGHVRLDLLDPLEVLLSKLYRLFWIVLKLDGVFVSNEVLTRSKSVGNASVSLLLPAAGITLNGWSIRVRLATYLHPLCTTTAVNAKLCFTRRAWTWLVWMAWYHTFVTALRLFLKASLSATLLLQFFYTGKAPTRKVANFLTLVTALKEHFAYLSAVRGTFVTEYICHQFFATIAKAGHILKTGGTISWMTPHRARVSTCKLFFAWTLA